MEQLLPVVSSDAISSGEKGSSCQGCSCGSVSEEAKARALALEAELQGRVQLAADGCSKKRHMGPMERSGRRSLKLDKDQPLPLVEPLSRHAIDGKYAWFAVEQAGLVVLNQADDERLRQLALGVSPAAVVDSQSQEWKPIFELIGRLASNGFIEGLRGHIEQRPNTAREAARFHLTQACQLECIHCYADSSPHIDRTGEIPLERWQKLLADFADYGGRRILFTGGEALMYQGCLDLMAQANEAGLLVTLLTNGILVPRYIDRIIASAHEVQVSLDGPTAEVNDPVRGAGTFPRIIKAIDLLAERGMPMRIGMSVMGENWQELRDGFLEFAKRYEGVDNLEFYLSGGITSWGRGDSIEGVDTHETSAVVRELMHRVNPDPGAKITRFAAGCGYFEQLVVGPWGHVYPCHLLDGAVAHIDDQPYPDLLRLLSGSRDLFSVDHVEGCKDCDIRYLCGGSCRVMNGKGEDGTRLVTNCTPAEYQRKINNIVQGWYGENAVEEVI